MNKNKKVFVFDIDGTLLDNLTHKVPKSAVESIKQLKLNGHIVGLATGRNESQFLKVLNRELFDFIILCNGSYVEVDGKVIDSTEFSLEEKKIISEVLDKHNLVYGITTRDTLYTSVPESDNIDRVLEQFNLIVPKYDSKFLEKETYQFMVYEACTNIEILQSELSDYRFHRYGDFGFDIDLLHVNKGWALQRLIEHFELDIKNVYAFGDGENDIDFLRIAGTGIALGNAAELTKEASDYVTTNVDDDGILNALKHFGFIS
ncbi:Cof-type HAD-IIB family hydrolase [Mycoplasmatota bacterium WC44]